MTIPALADLLARVEAATGPSSELDCEITIGLGLWTPPANAKRTKFDVWKTASGINHYCPHERITRSLDAALALVERQKGSGIDAAQMLHEALEDMANGGWRDDQPIGPQICRYLIAALLRALIAANADTSDRSGQKEEG